MTTTTLAPEHTCYGATFLGQTAEAAERECPAHEAARLRRLPRAMVQLEPYASIEDPAEPDFAAYVALAQCPVHGLEAVVGTRNVSTGYDTCAADELACGRLDPESIF